MVLSIDGINTQHESFKKSNSSNNNSNILQFMKKYQIARPLILEAIKKLGHDPKALPDSSGGGAGVKKLVREELKGHHIFEKDSSFDNHWSEMRKNEDLIEVYK